MASSLRLSSSKNALTTAAEYNNKDAKTGKKTNVIANIALASGYICLDLMTVLSIRIFCKCGAMTIQNSEKIHEDLFKMFTIINLCFVFILLTRCNTSCIEGQHFQTGLKFGVPHKPETERRLIKPGFPYF